MFWLAVLLALVLGGSSCSVSQDSGDTASEGSDSSESDGDEGDAENSKAGKESGAKDDDDEEEALPVDLLALDRGSIEAVVSSSTNLEAENEVMVLAEAARRVRSLLVEEGDRVKRGQVLLRLENAEQKSALAKAEAAFAQAEREYERQKRLFDQNLAAERTYNDAQFDFDQKKIALDDAKREMGYTEVRAPISGTITSRLVKVGDQVQIGQHLFDLVDFESLVARVYLPEKNISAIRPAQPVRIFAEAAGDEARRGEVARIAPVVDPKTGTVKVTVSVGSQPGLLPGMFVDVDIVTLVHDDVVLIPKRAIVYDDDRMFVFRAREDSRVDRVEVVPSLADRDFVEPMSGFSAGDQIVIAGQAGLKDGTLIEPVNTERETADAES